MRDHREYLILNNAKDDKNRCHKVASFEITSAEMDMDTAWLACEARRVVSISMIDKELPRNIESALW